MNLNFWNFRFTRLPFTVELGDTLDFATSPLRLQHLTLSALSLGDAGRLGIPVVHVSRCRTRWRSGKKLVTFCGLQFWSSHPMVQELKSLYLDLDLYLLVSFYHSISVSIYLSTYLSIHGYKSAGKSKRSSKPLSPMAGSLNIWWFQYSTPALRSVCTHAWSSVQACLGTVLAQQNPPVSSFFVIHLLAQYSSVHGRFLYHHHHRHHHHHKWFKHRFI